MKTQSCIWTKINIGLLLLPARQERGWDRHHSLLLGLVIPTRRSCWGFLSAHKHFGCFSKLPTSVQQWLPFLPAHETAFSEVTPQTRSLDKQRSVFCPLCNTPPSVFFFSLSAFIINTYIRTCPSLGKGSFCLVVSDCCQTAKIQNKPSQRREPGPSLAAATVTAICSSCPVSYN